MGHMPALCQFLSRQRREPVVAVQNLVDRLFTVREGTYLLHKGGDIVIEIMLMDGGQGASLNMDNPHVLADVNDARLMFICPTGKKIDAMRTLPQFTGKLIHIDVHAASILRAPRCIQWRRMDAEHGN